MRLAMLASKYTIAHYFTYVSNTREGAKAKIVVLGRDRTEMLGTSV